MSAANSDVDSTTTPAVGQNPVFGLETHGFDHIPDTERTMTLGDLSFFWVAAVANLVYLTLGVLVFALGLTVWQALIVAVVGSLTWAYVGVGAIGGVRSGLPTLTFTRAAYGQRGNKPQAFLAWLTSVAFEAINTILGVFAALALFVVVGWKDPGNVGKVVSLLAILIASGAMAYLGHATMIWLQRIFAVGLTVILAVVFAYTIGGVDLGASVGSRLPTGAVIATMFLGAGVVASGALSYLFNTADYSRYLPRETRGHKVFWTVFVSSGAMGLFLAVMGIVLASRGNLTDPVAGVKPLVPEWLFIAYAIAVLGGIVSNNILTFYSSGLVLQSVGLPLRRYRATLIDICVATFICVYVLLIAQDFITQLNNFVIAMVVWIGPFAGVWIVDGFLRRWTYDPIEIHKPNRSSVYWYERGFRVKALVAWGTGVVVGVLTMNAPFYTSPVATLLSGADLSWILGIGLAALVYWVLAKDEIGHGAAAVHTASRPAREDACAEEQSARVT